MRRRHGRATARRPETLDDLVDAHPGQVEALRLDVTAADGIAAVVADELELRLMVIRSAAAEQRMRETVN